MLVLVQELTPRGPGLGLAPSDLGRRRHGRQARGRGARRRNGDNRRCLPRRRRRNSLRRGDGSSSSSNLRGASRLRLLRTGKARRKPSQPMGTYTTVPAISMPIPTHPDPHPNPSTNTNLSFYTHTDKYTDNCITLDSHCDEVVMQRTFRSARPQAAAHSWVVARRRQAWHHSPPPPR